MPPVRPTNRLIAEPVEPTFVIRPGERLQFGVVSDDYQGDAVVAVEGEEDVFDQGTGDGVEVPVGSSAKMTFGLFTRARLPTIAIDSPACTDSDAPADAANRTVPLPEDLRVSRAASTGGLRVVAVVFTGPTPWCRSGW